MLTRMVGVRTPVLQATLTRRLIVAFRLDPEAAGYLVPAPFSVHLVNGFAVGVISLDRVSRLRPRGFPPAIGCTSENAAHRIAVEWDQGGRKATGAFVVARHTDSRLSTMLGDRFFPGPRERAGFDVADSRAAVRVAFTGRDRSTVEAAVVVTREDAGSDLFGSSEEAWRFFRRGALSYSLRRHGGLLDGVDARTEESRVQAAVIEHVSSSVFAAELGVPDSALVLRDVPVEWLAIPPPR